MSELEQNLDKIQEEKDKINSGDILPDATIFGIKGTASYNNLPDKPQINGVELVGNKTLEELGIQPKGDETDPTVPQYVKDITEEDISNWNNKIDEEYYIANTGDIKDYWGNAESFGIKTIVHALNHLTDWVKAHFIKKPVAIYDDPTGFEASNSDVGTTWHLTGLDLSPYKRLKFYVKSAGDTNDNFTPSHVVEMHLDDRAKGSSSIVTGHMAVNPNNRNRIHCVTFAVKNDLTSIQFVAANSLYGTASTASSGGRTCYLIEGYYD